MDRELSVCCGEREEGEVVVGKGKEEGDGFGEGGVVSVVEFVVDRCEVLEYFVKYMEGGMGKRE